MELITIGSSSRGNCYILRGEHETLILEAGIPWPQVLRACDFETDKITGCLITHEHGDHAGKAAEFIKNGIRIFASKGTIQALKIIPNYKVNPMEPMKPIQIGGFIVMGLPVEHDAREPFGFLINHQECGNTAFITDTAEIPYQLDSLSNLIVEANFDAELQNKNQSIPEFVKQRIRNSHMDIDNLINWLKRIDTSKLNNIILIHLSQGNSHAENFKKAIQHILPGKQVHIANPGLRLNFNSRPF